MHNNSNDQSDGKISDLDFSDLYQNPHIQLSFADLISKNEKDKPIIAAHPCGCNNVSELPEALFSKEISKKKITDELKKKEKEVKEEIKKECIELSKKAIEQEFNAIFALVEARNLPVLYIRWMPKSDEIFMASRGNHKGHFVCLYFFHDSNSNKSILVANPNGKATVDEYEAEVINSYLDKNKKVKIYQSRDYFQFGNTDCGPGALIFLRMLYNMSEADFFNVLKKGQHNEKNRENPFDYSSVEFGNFLQKEIEKRIGETVQDKSEGQKLRQADYAIATKVYKENNDAIKASGDVAFALKDIPFDQKFVDGLAEDQVEILRKILLSGKKLLTLEQIPQVEQNRQKLLKGSKDKKVRIQLGDGRIKDPKEQLSNEGHRPHQHTRENVKRVSEREEISYDTDSNCCISYNDDSTGILSTEIIDSDKKKNSSLKSKIALAATFTFSILGIVLFASFLSTNYIKKEVSTPGLVLSCAVLIVSIASILLTVNNVESKIGDPNMQQPIRSYGRSN